MSIDVISDEEIENLITMRKAILNLNARFVDQNGHQKKNFVVSGTLGYEFTLYLRQNTREGMYDDFSCGLLWLMPSGDKLTIVRYNGPNHSHVNKLDKVRLAPACHIHMAREDYIMAGWAAEGHATITGRYNTLEGALHCLVQDCNIVNLDTISDVIQQKFPF